MTGIRSSKKIILNLKNNYKISIKQKTLQFQILPRLLIQIIKTNLKL